MLTMNEISDSGHNSAVRGFISTDVNGNVSLGSDKHNNTNIFSNAPHINFMNDFNKMNPSMLINYKV